VEGSIVGRMDGWKDGRNDLREVRSKDGRLEGY